MGVAQLFSKVVEFGEVLHGAGAITKSHAFVAGELFGAIPVEVGAQTLEVSSQVTEQFLQLWGSESLGR